MKEPKISEKALNKFLTAYKQVVGESEQDDESE